MNFIDKISKINVGVDNSLEVLDVNNRTFSNELNISDYEVNDSFQVRKKQIVAPITFIQSVVDIETIEVDKILLIITDIYFDEDEYLIIKTAGDLGDLTNPSTNLVFSGTSGFTPSLNGAHFTLDSFYEDGFTYIKIYTQPDSGTWSGLGSMYLFKGYYIKTKTNHYHTSSGSYVYITNLTGFSTIVNREIFASVLDEKTLYIECSILGISAPTGTYGTQQAKLRTKNIGRITFDTSLLSEETINCGYEYPLSVMSAGASPTEQIVSGKDLRVVGKTNTYIDISLQSYCSSIVSTVVSFPITTKFFSPSILTGETIELVLKSKKIKRFVTLQDAIKEYDGGQIRFYAKDSIYSSSGIGSIPNEHLNLYLEEGSSVNWAITVPFNKNLIVEGQGTFLKPMSTGQLGTSPTNEIFIQAKRTSGFYINTAKNCYIDIKEHRNETGDNMPALNYHNLNSDTTLHFNFKNIIQRNNSSLLIDGNSYINGDTITTLNLGHCLIHHGRGTKCFANIKHLKSIQDFGDDYRGQYADCVAVEAFGDQHKELHLTFDLMEIVRTGTIIENASNCCNAVLGKLYLYNGTIISNVEKVAILVAGYGSAKLKNIKIKSNLNAALAIGTITNTFDYGTPPPGYIQDGTGETDEHSYGVQSYDGRVELDNCSFIGNSNIGVLSIAGNSSTNEVVNIKDCVIQNTDTSTDSNGIWLGNKVKELTLDNSMIVTGHSSAKSIQKKSYSINAIIRGAVTTVITFTEDHDFNKLNGDNAASIVKILNVVGTTGLNGNSYTVTGITHNTISIACDSSAMSNWISGGIVSTVTSIQVKRPNTVKTDKNNNYTTLTENTTAYNVVANLT